MRLEDPGIWSDPKEAQALGRERAGLEATVISIDSLSSQISDAADLLEIARAESDEASIQELSVDVDNIRLEVEKLEFLRMFSGEMDGANAFIDIQAGSGGTEAQDWAEMLLRMYMPGVKMKAFPPN